MSIFIWNIELNTQESPKQKFTLKQIALQFSKFCFLASKLGKLS